MKLLCRSAVAVLLIAGAGSIRAFAAGVDPGLLALTPPDTTTLLGIEETQAQATPIGKALLDQIHPDPATAKALAAAGFDPKRDLHEILASVPAAVPDLRANVLIVGRGSFHPDKIVAAAIAAGAPTTAYRGYSLIGGGQGNGANGGAVVFLDSTAVIAGDTPTVKAALDRYAAGTAFSGALAVRARQIAAANDAWVVTTAPYTGSAAVAAGGQDYAAFANLLQAAQQISAGLKLTATQVTLTADVLTRTPQDAQALVDILKFGIQMLVNSAGQGGKSSPGASLANAAQISATGSTLHAVLSVPEQQLEQLFLAPSPGQPKRIAAR